MVAQVNSLSHPTRKRIALLLVALAFLLAFAWLSLRYDPWNRKLRADPSIMLYVGQQILRGNPPYATVTIVKTPMAGFLAAGAVAVGRAVGWSDVLASRLGFILLGGALIAVTFLYGRQMWGWRAGIFSALVLLGLNNINQLVAEGPSPKVPFILFGAAALWFITRRAWFAAGVCAALAFMTWQPGLAFVGATLLAIFLLPRQEWRRAFLLALAGIAAPLLVLAYYFAVNDALAPALRQTFGATANYFGAAKASRNFISVIGENLNTLAQVTPGCFDREELFLPLAFVGWLVWLGAALVRARRGDRKFFRVSVPLLLAFGALGAFSLIDFQSCADLVPFFPFLALGGGWLLACSTRALENFFAARGANQKWLGRAFVGLLAAVVFLYGIWDVLNVRRVNALRAQQDMAAKIETYLAPHDSIQEFGDAVVLVFLHRENALSFIHLGDKQGQGILRAEGLTPEGLTARLAQAHPRVIILSRAKERDWAAPLYEWIETNYMLKESFANQEGGTTQGTDVYIPRAFSLTAP